MSNRCGFRTTRMSNILIFDLDDTLDPEITYVQSGFHAVANALRKLYGWDTKLVLFIYARCSFYNGPWSGF